MLNDQLLFFFSAIGVFNILLLCVFLFFGIKKRSTPHYLLLTLLFLFCIRVGVSCIYFFQKNLSPHWIQLGLSANFLIGPVVWSYVRLSLHQREAFNLLERIHFWGKVLLILTFGLIYTFKDHFLIWDHQIRYIIHFQLSIYLTVTAINLIPTFKKYWKNQQYITVNEWRPLFVFILTLLISVGFVVALFTTYVLGAVFTSIVFYLLFFVAVFRQKQVRKIFFTAPKYGNKKIDAVTAIKLTNKLERLMQEEELYKNALLKLEVVAKKMKISENQLSQLLNDNIGKSYAAYINDYRIQAAKEILKSDSKKTIESVAYAVGYNAKASFFTTFKKQTGMTPAVFKKQYTSSN